MPNQKENLRPKVGVGVLVFKDGKILLGKRKSDFAKGFYGSLGGHLEYMEDFEECVKREAKEEAGIEIENIKFLCVVNLKNHPPKHYVDIGFTADWKSGEPKVLEPDKCEGWGWYELGNLPDPLFQVINDYIEAYKTKF